MISPVTSTIIRLAKICKIRSLSLYPLSYEGEAASAMGYSKMHDDDPADESRSFWELGDIQNDIFALWSSLPIIT
jgi:hypothetical protein